MEPEQKVIVSVAEDRLDTLPEVVVALRAAGMKVDEVLEPLGTVTGSLGSGTVSALESVPGVVAVERQHGYQLPPEDQPQ
ncbi:hypothetical protein [Amycolatopsis nigrescens]|uniref:hypothetical protein n=1 Tax=Amycolatopsis nigrescens TaxID=381445 RepID=UPI00035C8A95|nr:hypothetical protein [Amycolatopsis nigrescens]